MKIKLLIYGIPAFFLWGCSNDTEADLLEPDPETTEDVISYTDDIRAIINANCLGCHSSPPVNGAPFPLTTYSQVAGVAESGSLLTAISRQTGETAAMPPTGRLPQATIDLIEQWIDEGLLEE